MKGPMEKNGKFFVSVIHDAEFRSSVWDPYLYRRHHSPYSLATFAKIRKLSSTSTAAPSVPFAAIEYRDIPQGNYLSFRLNPKPELGLDNLPIIGEGELLFGTMRAYLGNILITPRAAWLDRPSPLNFQVKSEFVVIAPHDHLHYFWLAYLRSKLFLENLPLGSGGTRPRLQPHALAQTPAIVPDLAERQAIHEQLQTLAQVEWANCQRIASVESVV
jgi:hypothetical protein